MNFLGSLIHQRGREIDKNKANTIREAQQPKQEGDAQVPRRKRISLEGSLKYGKEWICLLHC